MTNKQLKITLLSAAAVMAQTAQAEDHISLHYMQFKEYGDKIKAGDTVLSIEKSIGLDWTINSEFGFDTVSGASPSWGPTTPVVSVEDALSRAEKTDAAQRLTNEVIRAGYDPHRQGYEVQKYDLEDERKSVSVNATYRDTLRNEWTFGANASKESDYKSLGINGKGLIYADDKKNRSYSLGVSALFDKTMAFNPYTLSEGNTQSWKHIFTGSMEAGLSQIFTPNVYGVLTAYMGYREGYLSNHYLTVLREIDINKNGEIANNEVFLGQDTRPDKRISGGVNIQAFYAVSEALVIRPRYKWFTDDWGVSSHQIGGKFSYHITDSITLLPGYFWYHQTAANFYKDPTLDNPDFAAAGLASSDLRLGNFAANHYELGVSVKPISHWKVNVLAAYYKQDNGYEATWLAAGATYAF